MKYLVALSFSSLHCYGLTKSPYLSLTSFGHHTAYFRQPLKATNTDIIPTSQLIKAFFDVCSESSSTSADNKLEVCKTKGREILLTKNVPSSKAEAWR